MRANAGRTRARRTARDFMVKSRWPWGIDASRWRFGIGLGVVFQGKIFSDHRAGAVTADTAVRFFASGAPGAVPYLLPQCIPLSLELAGEIGIHYSLVVWAALVIVFRSFFSIRLRCVGRSG